MGVLLQGFFFDVKSASATPWWDHLAAQAHDLGRAGFSAIWLPPPLKGASGGFSNGYDPFDDYDLGSKDQKGTVPTHYGTREQRFCRKVGFLRILVGSVQRMGDHAALADRSSWSACG